MQYENRIKEVDSLKKEIDKHRPLQPEVLAQLKEYYRIGLTYSSNALEGNSLTETETKVVLEDGITIGGKPVRDHSEALGHSEAYSKLYDCVKDKKITEEQVCEFHRLFYHRMDQEQAGIYRKENVIITGSEFIPPGADKIESLMKEFLNDLVALRQSSHPVEFAARLHLKFVSIHPFIDGNGRTARLLMNLSLMQDGYAITIIPPVVRADYIQAIKAAQVGAREEVSFINFISTMVFESMNDYRRLIKSLKQ